MASAIEMSVSRTTLDAVIRRVRNRWRLKLALRGLTIVLAAVLAAALVGSWAMEQYRFAPGVVVGARIATWVLLAVLAVRYLVLPQLRRVSDERVALYLEEHEPTLEASVLSAVESARHEAPDERRSRSLVSRLLDVAAERASAVGGGARLETRSVGASAGMLAAMAAITVLSFGFGPEFLRNGARMLATPWLDAREARPYFINVEPGNIEIPRGGDQSVAATLHGFDTDATDLVVRRGAATEWERLPMSAAADSATYELRLFDVKERTEYYVEANGVRSPTYRIDVTDLPFVQQIDLEYHYPAYTGMAVETVEDGGDIAAPQGTEVILRATTTIPVTGGRLLIDGKPPLPMTRGADGVLQGTITVEQNGFYKIELDARNGRAVDGSLDYTIDVLADKAPTIAFLQPGRDARVTAVEEVFTEIEATDDFGVGAIDLVYRVNGGDEQVVSLHSGASRLKEIVAGHTFFLEEFGLVPGDLVSYYARARDNNRGGAAREARTDIYFMTVRPFGQDYRQSQQQPGGGGGGGAGGADPGQLTQIQREIIAGTFKVDRDQASLPPGEVREHFTTLQLSQGKLREQVETLVRRLAERRIVDRDSAYRTIAEELPLALEEMKVAETELGNRSAKDALPPEQKALQHLQRAEAAYRDIQVSMGGGQGGGGGGQQSNAEDLADLFELERDQLRNQYETENRSRQEAADNQVDETAEKLRQLAARQQQENERLRSRASAAPNQSGGSGGGQRQLAEETEQLARQLERLARERPNDQELRESARRLQEAANAMRRSATGANDGGQSQAASALQRLEEARRLLDQNREGRGQRDATDAARRAERIADEQRDIANEVEQLGSQPGGSQERAEREARISQRKDALRGEVGELESQLDELSRESRRDQPEASRDLQEAAGTIRQSRLQDRIQYGKGLMRARNEQAPQFEREIAQYTDSVSALVSRAAVAMREGAAEQQQEERSLDRARDLVRGMESLDERMEQRRLQGGNEPGAGQGGQQGDSTQQAQAGQQGQGQGQGQSGQQGQGKGQSGQQGQGQAGQQGQGQSGQQGQGQAGQQGQGQAGQQGQGQSGQQGQGGGGQARGERGGFGVTGGSGGAGPATGARAARGGERGGELGEDDVRQFTREYRNRMESARELQRELRELGLETDDLERTIEQMRGLGAPGTYEDMEAVERLQAEVIEGLKAFEFALRRQMGAGDESRPVLGGNSDVPAEFKALVEEYYRSLARKPKP